MKTKTIFSLVILAVFAATSQVLAAGHGGGGFGGGGFHGGGFGGAHFGGGFGGAAHFGGAQLGSFGGGGYRTIPHAFGRSSFAARNLSTSPRSPQLSYTRPATPALSSRTLVRQPARSIASSGGRIMAVNRQQNLPHMSVAQNRHLSSSQISAATERAITNHHLYARHDGTWHHDWDKNRFHYWNGHWWSWYGGNWIGFDAGFYPFDYVAYGGYPWDYSGYPDASYNYPYSSYGYYNPYAYDYYDDSAYSGSSQYANGVVGRVQSQLDKLGYYHGAIDGLMDDQTEAAIAQYQEDHDLSVTGTITAAMLYSLGLD